jgi:dihydrofolate reductase
MMTSLIVAASRNEVIGAGGTLPWYLPDDLRRFRRLTRGHAVLVGRLTHEDIVSRLGRPLPGRTSVVLSSAGAGAGAGSGAGSRSGSGLAAGAGAEAGAGSTAGAGAGSAAGSGSGSAAGGGAGLAAGAGAEAGVVWVASLAHGLAAARDAERAARTAEAAAEPGGPAWAGPVTSGASADGTAADGAAADGAADEVFVIGGTSVYRQALPHVDRIYLTRVHREVAGDTVMPENWLAGFRLTSQEDRPAQGGESAYSWLDYVRETD